MTININEASAVLNDEVCKAIANHGQILVTLQKAMIELAEKVEALERHRVTVEACLGE